MPRTVEITNNFEWTERLGCPASACSDHVKKIFNRGITGILWEEIGSTIHPIDEVLQTRKNILLYYLNSQGQTPAIQQIRNKKRLQSERVLLNTQVGDYLAECEKKENSIKEKALKLEKIRAEKKAVLAKKNLLEFAHREMKDKMKNCKDVRAVCQELLPPSQSGIDENIMRESLALVGAISSRVEKRKAWKQIQESLGPIVIPELWDWLLRNRIKNNEELCKLKIEDDKDVNNRASQLDIGIARARGKQVESTISKLINLEKAKDFQRRSIEYLERISEFSENEEVTRWLITLMEVTKNEAIQKTLQSEIEKLKQYSEEQNIVALELHELESDINDVDYQIEQCVRILHKSLGVLQTASNFLLSFKNHLSSTLETIVTLNSQSANVPSSMNSNLSHELEVFQENLDINALNKIMLSGKVGAYRHTIMCMGNAAIACEALSQEIPVFQPPLYHLLSCYAEIIANKILKQKKGESEIANQLDINLTSSIPSFARERDIIELLDEASSRSRKCQEEIAEINSIFDAWINQPVQEVMAINDNIVHGATYNEWLQRYSTLIYMVQRAK